MFTAAQLVAHLLGDYVFQSHWMATTKTLSSRAAFWHALAYTLAFVLLVTWHPLALFLIFASHYLIDRYRLAVYVVWLKNQLAPRAARFTLAAARPFGYPPGTDKGLAMSLLIVADNVLHVLCNAVAVALVNEANALAAWGNLLAVVFLILVTMSGVAVLAFAAAPDRSWAFWDKLKTVVR